MYKLNAYCATDFIDWIEENVPNGWNYYEEHHIQKMKKEDIESGTTGNTYKWFKGAGYYSDDSELLFLVVK